MTSTTKVVAQNIPSTDREALLRLAARRSMVFRDVMRHAVQQLRRDLSAGCPTDETTVEPDRNTGPTISDSQFRILRCLVDDGPLTVSQVAESCRVSVPAISRMLNHLETNGLIERHVDSANRRVIRVVATDEGRAARDDMYARFGVALVSVLSPLTDAELTDLIRAFDHLDRLVVETQPTL